MISETVLIALPPVQEPSLYYLEHPQLAYVTADFWLHNPTNSVEAISVGFPSYLNEDSRGADVPEVQDLRVLVNDQPLTTESVRIEGALWDVWNMTFGPGDTRVRVSYNFIVTSIPGWSFSDIKYVFHTGAGWAGAIGQADLTVQLPFLAEENLIDRRTRPPGYTLNGYNLSWHFESLEPTTDDDLVLRVVSFDLWYEVLAARRAVSDVPSAENYAKLARRYADAVWSAYPGEEATNPVSFYNPLLAQVAEVQYRKALELDPGDAALRREYVDFVMTYAGSLLPGNSNDYLSALPATVTFTPLPAPTIGLQTPTSKPASPTVFASLTPVLLLLTPTHTATQPATQVAALSTVPLFTPVPVPSGAGGNPLNTVLLVTLVALIAVGLVIALRRRAS
jgi:hypothetical protein